MRILTVHLKETNWIKFIFLLYALSTIERTFRILVSSSGFVQNLNKCYTKLDWSMIIVYLFAHEIGKLWQGDNNRQSLKFP